MSAALPPLPWGDDFEAWLEIRDTHEVVEAMQTHAQQARADLEAENKRLREALEAVVSFWDRLNFDGSPINELHTAARAALKEQP